MTTTYAQRLPETPDLLGAFPRLSDEQIVTLGEHGMHRSVAIDEVLIQEGEPCDEFFVILRGRVAVIEDFGGEPRIVRVHGRRRFLGEIGLLKGEAAFVTSVTCEAGEVLSIPLENLPAATAHDPVLSDLILRAYLVRRSLLVGAGAGFRIIGSSYSPDSRRLREFAARNRLPFRWIDLEKDQQAETLLNRLGIEPSDTPVVIWAGHQVLRNPSNAELAKLVGLDTVDSPRTTCDLAIVGAGPAGLAAAVYAASDGLRTVVVDAIAAGGQASTSPRIENYLGFPAGVSGSELADRAVVQARKFGAQLRVPAQATGLTHIDGRYVVRLENGSALTSRAVLIATGVRYRRLDVAGIERFEGTCVHYAATQHEARVCGPEPVAVVGGGNSAGQAALFLADHVPRVYLVSRDELSQDMSRYVIAQIEANPRIQVLPHCEVRELAGNTALRSVLVQDTLDEQYIQLDVGNLFVFIGAEPHTSWLAGTIELDDRGYVLAGRDLPDTSASRAPPGLETSCRGVFVAGDVRAGSVKRVAAAVGEGAMAVRLVFDHLIGRSD
ncbi:MAG TPA: FAD-dependent oxidoreductase [Jatrophihabitantaceae bacterium]